MKKEVTNFVRFKTILPGVQMISPKTYRARVTISGVQHRKLFTNKAEAVKWRRNMLKG